MTKQILAFFFCFTIELNPYACAGMTKISLQSATAVKLLLNKGRARTTRTALLHRVKSLTAACGRARLSPQTRRKKNAREDDVPPKPASLSSGLPSLLLLTRSRGVLGLF